MSGGMDGWFRLRVGSYRAILQVTVMARRDGRAILGLIFPFHWPALPAVAPYLAPCLALLRNDLWPWGSIYD